MIATVRLNDELAETLNSISKKFHKKKSRIEVAIEKTKEADLKECKSLESGLSDGL